FFFSSRRRHTRFSRDWSSDVCSSDLHGPAAGRGSAHGGSDDGYPAGGRCHENTRILSVKPVDVPPPQRWAACVRPIVFSANCTKSWRSAVSAPKIRSVPVYSNGTQVGVLKYVKARGQYL